MVSQFTKDKLRAEALRDKQKPSVSMAKEEKPVAVEDKKAESEKPKKKKKD